MPDISSIELPSGASYDLKDAPARAVMHTHLNKSVIDGITASDVTSWNSKGTYSKPSTGIPKTDLDSSVQTSLEKADTALQAETYTGTVTTTGTMTSGHIVTSNGGTVIKDSGYTIAKSVPSDAVFTDTDTKVTQTLSTTSSNYPIILKYDTSTSTSVTNTTKYSSKALINPYTGNLTITQINGTKVGSSPKFTDTVTTVTNSGSGNAVTSISASLNGVLAVTKGSTFLTSHQDISGKENTSNKVTSWSDTVSNTNYPSEKLVKDYFDTFETNVVNAFNQFQLALTPTSSNNWHVLNFGTGFCIQWSCQRCDDNANVNQTWGSGLICSQWMTLPNPTFPVPFTDQPYVNVRYLGGDADYNSDGWAYFDPCKYAGVGADASLCLTTLRQVQIVTGGQSAKVIGHPAFLVIAIGTCA